MDIQFWEDRFTAWSKPPSDSETARCENVEKMIRDAIRESSILEHKTIRIFAQGSYRNDTNIRQGSDVDINVRLSDVIFYDFAQNCGYGAVEAGITPASYSFSQYRNDVEKALVAKFGRPGVTRGDKAFDVHANSYRVDADVVASFEYREYLARDYYGRPQWRTGTRFYSDSGKEITNWPDQHYESGVRKNTLTNKRFKRITRILKRLRDEMQEKNIVASKDIASFLIESLIWNVPSNQFMHYRWVDSVRAILMHTFNSTLNDLNCKDWTEVNEIKYLFHSTQPWTRIQAHNYLNAAWDYIGYD